jgi:Matrixin
LYLQIQSCIIVASFGVLLVSMTSQSHVPLLFHSAVASSDYDIFEELDHNTDEDFEEDNSIQLCCNWSYDLADGILTYYIDHNSSLEEQDAVRDAIEEWDSRIDSLELETVSSMENSDIRIWFEDDSEEVVEGEEIAGQTVTIFDEYGFLDNAQITISRSIQAYDFDTSTIEQVAKHEMGHALGLGHANFDGNLMAQSVNDGTDNISECEIKAVVETNYWKLGKDNGGNTDPDPLQESITTCEVDEERCYD